MEWASDSWHPAGLGYYCLWRLPFLDAGVLSMLSATVSCGGRMVVPEARCLLAPAYLLLGGIVAISSPVPNYSL